MVQAEGVQLAAGDEFVVVLDGSLLRRLLLQLFRHIFQEGRPTGRGSEGGEEVGLDLLVFHRHHHQPTAVRLHIIDGRARLNTRNQGVRPPLEHLDYFGVVGEERVGGGVITDALNGKSVLMIADVQRLGIPQVPETDLALTGADCHS